MIAPRAAYGTKKAALALAVAVVVLVPRITDAEVIAGIDHLPVAVKDLERAARDFARLGFTLKAGRPHANGIRNAHVKFPDGSGIELIAVRRAVDAQTRRYVDFLEGGEGAAYIAFHARDMARLAAALEAAHIGFREAHGIVTLRDPRLGFVFFVRDNRSPTDRPEHFAHANGATAMSGVWLVPVARDAFDRLMIALGARKAPVRVTFDGAIDATAYTLDNGSVYVLPGTTPRGVARRPIVGVTFTVRDLSAAARVLAVADDRPGAAPAGARLVVGPERTHGVRIEFAGR
jgi:hypothetical protein